MGSLSYTLWKACSLHLQEVMARLEAAQEHRTLSDDEFRLCKILKCKILGLAAIERSRAKQKSRLTWIRNGDANTKYFHLMASIRKKKNFMGPLSNGSEMANNQSEKQRIVFDHYSNHIGACCPRNCGINFQALGWQPLQLQHLDDPFTEQEVTRTINVMPKEKARARWFHWSFLRYLLRNNQI
jgi:hypothetical protein